jgi:hypothetical protein
MRTVENGWRLYEKPAALAVTPLESIERSAFYRITLERLRSAVIKASARPELENSQPKADNDCSGYFAAQINH